MKQLLLLVLLLTVAFSAPAQRNALAQYDKATALLQSDNIPEAYKTYKELRAQVSQKDTLYKYVVWYYLATATELEKQYRLQQDFKNSLAYGLEALHIIQSNKAFFDQKFAAKEYWMNKNILVSYFGLNDFSKAAEYRRKLYQAYQEKALPEGLDGYFNFDYFKLGDKNIWGYEWYPELPADRFSTSFTKVVYYVYSTNPDGTDKDQLFRLHVLMFHQSAEDTKFDYLLERQVETADATISGSYYQYLYKKDIDYRKLKADVIEIVTKGVEPSSRRITPRRKG